MTQSSSAARRHTGVWVDTQTTYYKWFVAGTVLLAGATQTFAGNSVNLAIPRIMAAFGTDLTTTQWVTTSFLITRTLMVPILGWLGGFLGNRNLFICSMLGFVVASIGCGLAVNIPMLIAFRLMQGLVLGPLEGLTVILLINAFPPHQRGLAIGMRTIGWSTGQIVSFTIGGYLLEEVSWRMIFLIGIPGGLASAMLGFMFLRQEREFKGIPIDYAGLLALATFLVPLLLLISFGRRDDTETSTLLLLAGTTLAGSVAFVARELLATFPAVNLRLFRNPGFCLLCATAFLNTLGLFGAQFMIPIFLQRVLGLTPLQAGLTIVPALIVSAFGGTLSGRLTDLFSPRVLIIVSLGLLVLVFNAFSTVTALTTVGVMVVYIIAYRLCLFSINTPITSLNVTILDHDQVRMGQGLLGMVRNIGASLGVTVSSVIFESFRLRHQLQAYTGYDPASPEHRALFSEITRSLRAAGINASDVGTMALRVIRQQMSVEAVTASFRDTFFAISFCFLLAMIPMFFVSRRMTRREI
jgi:DHA2 family multidrug resistance protein